MRLVLDLYYKVSQLSFYKSIKGRQQGVNILLQKTIRRGEAKQQLRNASGWSSRQKNCKTEKKSWRPYQIGEFLQQCGLSDLLTYAKGYHKLILPGIHICRHGKYPDARRRHNHKSFGNYPDHGCNRIPSRNKWRNRTLWPSEFA